MLTSKTFGLGLCAVLLTACATGIQSTANRDALDPSAKWALLPIANNTDTPQAGLSAEAMVEHQLRRRGIMGLQHYPLALPDIIINYIIYYYFVYIFFLS